MSDADLGPAGGDDDQDLDQMLVYELDPWTPDERGALDQRLTAAGIVHQWEAPTGADLAEGYEPGHPWIEGTDLLVGEHDEAAVEALIDDIDSPDALAAEEDDGGADEANYAIMANLYVAADRLKDDPDDLGVAGEFFDAADGAVETPVPFGIDAEVWRRVQALAAEVAKAIEDDAETDVVRSGAQKLRDLLFGYV